MNGHIENGDCFIHNIVAKGPPCRQFSPLDNISKMISDMIFNMIACWLLYYILKRLLLYIYLTKLYIKFLSIFWKRLLK